MYNIQKASSIKIIKPFAFDHSLRFARQGLYFESAI